VDFWVFLWLHSFSIKKHFRRRSWSIHVILISVSNTSNTL